MNYNKQYFKGAKPASSKYIEDYLTFNNYFNNQGYQTLILRPFVYTSIPVESDGEIKYYKTPLTNHSFNDGDFTEEFALQLLAQGEIGLGLFPNSNAKQNLCIIDVDNLSGDQLIEFKKYIDSRNIPYINSKKGVHMYGTLPEPMKGANGVSFQIGNFKIAGEVRTGGSGYCVLPPTKWIKDDLKTIGCYSIGNTCFMELIAMDEPIPVWSNDIVEALNSAKKTNGNNTKVDDMLKILKGTERGKGQGVYDMNLREIGRIIRNIRKNKDITSKIDAREGLELALEFNKKHKKGYSDEEVSDTYWDVYKKELATKKEFSDKAKKIPKVDINLSYLKEKGIRVVTDKHTSEVYLKFENKTNMLLGGDECTKWLIKTIEPENVGELKNIEMRLKAMSEATVDIRSRISKNGSILYNLNNEGKVVKIGDGKWDIVQDYGLERFKIVSGEGVQVIPKVESTVSDTYKIFKYMNVEEHLKPLVICVLVSYLTPNIAYPILNIYGEKGSGKSTMASFIKRLIDPNELLLDSAEYKKIDDLIITLNNGHLTVFDNVKRITAEFGDMLTKVSTGIGFRGRTLFTDKGVTTFSFKKPIIITSVAQEMQREDLLSRSILIESLPFDANIVPEMELIANFKDEVPDILGSLFSILSKIDGTEVDKDKLIRLTDFHIICRKVEKVMGWEKGTVDLLLERNLDIQEEESFENSLVGQEIKSYIENNRFSLPVEISTQDLYGALCDANDGFERKIRNSRILGKELGKIKQTLNRLGYKLRQTTYVKGINQRGWVLEKLHMFHV